MSQVGRLINLPVIADERGTLVVAEEHSAHIPFSIHRVYYMYGMRAARGFHAHHHLRQVAVCMRGACTFVLDNGCHKSRQRLENPAVGLLVEKMIWHEMHDFSDDCLLTVFASAPYDEADYIRDYGKFLALLANDG